MIKQNTDWGQILWLAENREILPLQGLQEIRQDISTMTSR